MEGGVLEIRFANLDTTLRQCRLNFKDIEAQFIWLGELHILCQQLVLYNSTFDNLWGGGFWQQFGFWISSLFILLSGILWIICFLIFMILLGVVGTCNVLESGQVTADSSSLNHPRTFHTEVLINSQEAPGLLRVSCGSLNWHQPALHTGVKVRGDCSYSAESALGDQNRLPWLNKPVADPITKGRFCTN